MTLMKFKILVLALVFSCSALAVKPIYSGGKERAALRGYDVVSYFTENKPVKGSPEHVAEVAGAKWLFSSAENKAAFLADPQKYMPQYGGYCAYAVANDTTASSKPQYFTIHDGKLYMNYSRAVNKKWLKDKEGYIEEADRNWPEIVND